MKKITRKTRFRDALRVLKQRRLGERFYLRVSRKKRRNDILYLKINKNIDMLIKKGMRATISNKRMVKIYLPERMNLSVNYADTIPYINSIVMLSDYRKSGRSYRLSSVIFDGLKEISSSAALMLTAALSRWDDNSISRIVPRIENWNYGIYEKFKSLGFFDLFRKIGLPDAQCQDTSTVKIVRYIKGCRAKNDYSRLKEQLREIVGGDITKWTFLHSGLDEAITNVSHHAYPKGCNVRPDDQNWYLTAAFDLVTRELKVIFCDQGIGIPKSLPTSKLWEKVLEFLSVIPVASQRKDSNLIRAAMEISRTSTGKSDRGKGLPDMKEFVRQRGHGYLALMSGSGLYKLTVETGIESQKSDVLPTPVLGTLIIWRVQL